MGSETLTIISAIIGAMITIAVIIYLLIINKILSTENHDLKNKLGSSEHFKFFTDEIQKLTKTIEKLERKLK